MGILNCEIQPLECFLDRRGSRMCSIFLGYCLESQGSNNIGYHLHSVVGLTRSNNASDHGAEHDKGGGHHGDLQVVM